MRRRTRPIVCFVNVESVDRILSSIYNRFNLKWDADTFAILHKLLDGAFSIHQRLGDSSAIDIVSYWCYGHRTL